MAEVVLFHSVLGLTEGVTGFADDLRAAGHTVHTPDLFEGQTFDSIEAGMDNIRSIGFEAAAERGVRAADALSQDVVYGGFSFGVMPAMKLTATRPGAKGGLFFDGFADVSYFGTWPDGLPAQIHAMDHDPFFVDEGDIEVAQAFVDATEEAEMFLYPGNNHLFSDRSMPWYDEGATRQMTERVLAFLRQV